MIDVGAVTRGGAYDGVERATRFVAVGSGFGNVAQR